VYFKAIQIFVEKRENEILVMFIKEQKQRNMSIGVEFQEVLA